MTDKTVTVHLKVDTTRLRANLYAITLSANHLHAQFSKLLEGIESLQRTIEALEADK